jgi:probable F420-dependent oxidoreductase
MQIGIILPQNEIGDDPGAIREFAAAAEDEGFEHIVAFDHVVGRDDYAAQPFHEPFVLFGFIAACTRTIELTTGIIILPQRQTVLAAKQAAEVDLLTGGRFRLGVGLGWNPVEYEALGKEFSNRGERLDEQVTLMRRLWAEPSVTHSGAHETVTGAGLAPLPVQRPIPVWFGGVAERALRRIGRLGDGWFPQVPPGDRLDEARAIVTQAAIDAGRDPDALGMEGRIGWETGDVDKLARQAGKWRDAGATHLGVNTMGAGLASVDDHLATLAKAADALAPLNP